MRIPGISSNLINSHAKPRYSQKCAKKIHIIFEKNEAKKVIIHHFWMFDIFAEMMKNHCENVIFDCCRWILNERGQNCLFVDPLKLQFALYAMARYCRKYENGYFLRIFLVLHAFEKRSSPVEFFTHNTHFSFIFSCNITMSKSDSIFIAKFACQGWRRHDFHRYLRHFLNKNRQFRKMKIISKLWNKSANLFLRAERAH
jgi:hypothetical protein